MSLLDKVTVQVKGLVSTLCNLQYDPLLIGGVLRVAALGGSTADVDIALIVPSNDKFIHTTLEHLGFDLVHTQDSKYADETNGFLADYRKDDVNIILYSAAVYTDVRDLVSSFDLNINKYYLEDGALCNDYFDGYVVLYTENSNHQRHLDRITRFSLEYPDLDWTQPKLEQEKLIEQATR